MTLDANAPLALLEIPDVGELTLVPVDPDRDAQLLHSWVLQDRAQFWMMQDYTVDDVRDTYRWITDQPTHTAFLGQLNGHPILLGQTYDPRAEVIAEHYPVRDGDLGVHFMIGPDAPHQVGFALAAVPFLLGYVLTDPAVRRLIAEPDSRNAASQALALAIGFHDLGPIDLPHKPARLLVLDREQWERP